MANYKAEISQCFVGFKILTIHPDNDFFVFKNEWRPISIITSRFSSAAPILAYKTNFCDGGITNSYSYSLRTFLKFNLAEKRKIRVAYSHLLLILHERETSNICTFPTKSFELFQFHLLLIPERYDFFRTILIVWLN